MIHQVSDTSWQVYIQIDIQGFKPPVLIFVESIDRAKQLFHELVYDGINVDVIHSDRTQAQVRHETGLHVNVNIKFLMFTTCKTLYKSTSIPLSNESFVNILWKPFFFNLTTETPFLIFQRDTVIKNFRSGHTWVLIATDLVGRGLDFKGVNLVINYDFPRSIASYIHRIGRTGRAGRSGEAITYFTKEDAPHLRR